MTRYLEIVADQDPFPAGVDTNARTMFACNYSCIAANPVAKFEEEIGRILFDAGLAVFNTNCWIGPDARIPVGDGPYITLINTGGTSPIETHNGDKYRRMSIQVVVRALTYQAARTRARAIWDELDGKRNFTVVAA